MTAKLAIVALTEALTRLKAATPREPPPPLMRELTDEDVADELLYASWCVTHPGLRALLTVASERLRRIGAVP